MMQEPLGTNSRTKRLGDILRRGGSVPARRECGDDKPGSATGFGVGTRATRPAIKENNMEGALILAFTVAQVIVELLFVVWIWIRRSLRETGAAPTKREQLLWLAAVSFTIGVAIHLYYGFAHGIEASYKGFLIWAGISFSCVGFVLALVGRGNGRIVTTIASLELAACWLMFP